MFDDILLEDFRPEELNEFLTLLASSQESPYLSYADDPVRFGEEVLGEFYTADVMAVMRSVLTHRVTIARSANAVGKTHCAARLAVWGLMTHREAQIHTLAAPPISNLETKLWGEIGSVVARHSALFERYRMKHLHIERSALDFLHGIVIPAAGSDAEREASVAGAHRGYILYIVDEGDAVPEAVYRGIESCMSGADDHLLIMVNPRDPQGLIWEMEQEGRANVVELSAFNHPNVILGEQVIPGAVSRETTLRRIEDWTEPAQGLDGPETFQLPVYLGAGFRKVKDNRFSYMVLGKYSAIGEAFYYPHGFLLALQEEMRDFEREETFPGQDGYYGTIEWYEEPLYDTEYVLAADVAEGFDNDKKHDFTCADVFRLDTREQVACYWGQTSLKFAANDLYRMAEEYLNALVIPERTGPGVALIENLEEYPVRIYKHEFGTEGQPEHTRRGFPTNIRTKAMRDERLRGLLQDAAKCWENGLAESPSDACRIVGCPVVRSLRSLKELAAYSQLPNRKRGGVGSHDDHNTSVTIATYYMDEHRPLWLPQRVEPSKPILAAGGGGRRR